MVMTSIRITATPRKARRRAPCHLVRANRAPKREGLSSPGRSMSIGVRCAKRAGDGVEGLEPTTAATAKAGSVMPGRSGPAFDGTGVEAGVGVGLRAGFGAVTSMWRGAACGPGVAAGCRGVCNVGVSGRTRKRFILALSILTGPPSTRCGGREVNTFGTGCVFPKVVFGVWRGVCVPGRLYLNGSISCNNPSIYP